MAYDFGNMCEMFLTVLKGVQIANQDNRPEEVESICLKAKRNIEKLKEREESNA